MTRAAPGVAIVVPTRNSARTIGACLESARAQRDADVELVVVDNHSQDATRAIAAPLADRVIVAGPERSAQRNVGARATTGETLLFLDSDMTLEPTVATEALAVLRAHPDHGALVVPELSHGDGYWAHCRMLEKRLYLGDPRVEAARLFRRSAFETVGGYDESLVAGEDFDLADRVANAGWLVSRIESRVWHDEGRVRPSVVFTKKRYYGRWMAQWARRSDARSRLWRTSLVAHPGALVAEPVHAVGLAVLKIVDAAGLAAGIVDARRQRW